MIALILASKHVLFSATILISLLLLFCQIPIVFGEGLIICNSPNKQFFPVVISDGAGGAVFAWEDGRNGEDLDIYIQRVDANGNTLWQKNGIPVCQEPYNQRQVNVVLSIDGFMLFWLDNRSGKGWDVYAQFIDLEGKLLWQKGGVPLCTSLGDQESITAISDGFGGGIVVWEDHRSKKMDIYAQRVNHKGEFLWTKDGLAISDPTGDQYNPVLVSDGTGGAIIAWWDIGSPDWHIFAQHVSADGVLLWDTPLMVSPKDGIQGEPRIASDNAGGAIVTWQNYENYTSNDVFAQRIDGKGRKLWNEEGVPICEAPGTQSHPAIVSDLRGGAVVVWCDRRDVFSDLYIQHISTEGKVSWKKDGVELSVAPGIQDTPFILNHGSGYTIVFWNDYREDYGDDLAKDIYAQKVDSHGNIMWLSDGVKICNLKNSQNLPIASTDGAGGAFTVWSDAREDTGDIYFQLIRSDSSLVFK